MNIFSAVAGLSMAFIIMQIISFNVEGEAGLAATSLTTSIGTTDTTISVISTQGFLDADFVFVEGETICYSGKTDTLLTGLTRGCQDTDPQSHPAGTRVYNESTGIMNQVVGFNIAETMSSSGAIRVVTMVPGALMHAISKIVMWDYSYLDGDLFGLQLAYFKYMFLYPMSAGFIFGFAVLMINVFMGIARLFT